MISPFLSKLLMTRQASFTEDELDIFEVKFALQPMEALVNFQKSLNDEKKMEMLGELISNAIIDHFKKRFAMEEKQITTNWTNIFNISGFGRLEIIAMSEDVAVFQIKNGNFPKKYMAVYGIQKEPVCHVIKGAVKNMFERVSGKKVVCKETSCIAMGKNICTFEVKTI